MSLNIKDGKNFILVAFPAFSKYSNRELLPVYIRIQEALCSILRAHFVIFMTLNFEQVWKFEERRGTSSTWRITDHIVSRSCLIKDGELMLSKM